MVWDSMSCQLAAETDRINDEETKKTVRTMKLTFKGYSNLLNDEKTV